MWDTADKYLRNVVGPEEYGDYIIPFKVLRRIECLLKNHKQDILDLAAKLTNNGNKELNPLIMDSGVRAQFNLPFYSTSKLDLEVLGKTDDSVEEGLTEYPFRVFRQPHRHLAGVQVRRTYRHARQGQPALRRGAALLQFRLLFRHHVRYRHG